MGYCYYDIISDRHIDSSMTGLNGTTLDPTCLWCRVSLSNKSRHSLQIVPEAMRVLPVCLSSDL